MAPPAEAGAVVTQVPATVAPTVKPELIGGSVILGVGGGVGVGGTGILVGVALSPQAASITSSTKLIPRVAKSLYFIFYPSAHVKIGSDKALTAFLGGGRIKFRQKFL
jgi:hypothetical protein